MASKPLPVFVHDRAQYDRDGYTIRRGWLDNSEIEHFERNLHTIGDIPAIHTAEFRRILMSDNFAAATIYNRIRNSAALRNFCAHPSLTERAAALLEKRQVRISHCRLRMDLPLDTRYTALWHQDHEYVGGETNTITAWIPLQDIDWEIGPLLIAPGTHLIAPRVHSKAANDRRVCFPRESERIEAILLNRGDVLFFHSLLLHSGQVNFSDRVRFSVQARYS